MVRLLKADGVTVAASATVDFGPLAQGVDQFAANNTKFTAADSQAPVPDDARLDVKVWPLEELYLMGRGKNMTMHE